MLVQYICAAAGAAAVVRWVDGCGRAQKRTALWVEPESGSAEAKSFVRATSSIAGPDGFRKGVWRI